MICDKCKKEFPDPLLELSHDIPRYLGGLDSDGRRYLCHKCHSDYELEVLKIIAMDILKSSPESEKFKWRNKARFVRDYFFKENKK